MSYEILKELTSFRDVVNHYKEYEGETYLMLGTGGWHGSTWTLEDCERILDDKDEVWTKNGAYITVFIFVPKEVLVRWGNVKVKNLSEIEWLRKKVRESIELVKTTQEVNA